jgi:hypothetical protein
MKELNERTALNRRLQEDAQATRRQAEEAMGRKMVRCINRAYRKSVTTVAVDAALAGSMLTAGVAALACLCTGVL